MSALRAKPAAGYPWTLISSEQIQSIFESKTERLKYQNCPAIESDSLPSMRDVLIDVFNDKKLKNQAVDALETHDPEAFLLPFVEEEPCWIVRCSITDSLVPGVWGIKYTVIGDSGYFYNYPIFGVGDDISENLPIVGAWTPAHDKRAARKCLIGAYTSYWDRFALPPAMGQWVDGPPDLLADAITSVLEHKPDEWCTILNRLREDLADDERRLQELAIVNATVQAPDQSDTLKNLKQVLVKGCDPGTLTKQQCRVLVAAFIDTMRRGGL